MLPAASQMPLATGGTWGHFEPGYVCGAVSWAVELTGGRAAASGKLQPPHFTRLHDMALA